MGQFSKELLVLDSWPGLSGLNQVYGPNHPTLSD